jgi:RND family efflux transporter MFP subunit
MRATMAAGFAVVRELPTGEGEGSMIPQIKWSVLALALLVGACSQQKETSEEKAPRPVAAFQVGLYSGLGQRQFIGLARAGQVSTLSFRVPGQILNLPVSVGQELKRGDLVASLDEGPFSADMAKLEADLGAAIADATAKDLNYRRISGLVKTGAYSQALADSAQGESESAAAKVESVRSAIVRAKIDLDSTVLKAPYDGQVVNVYPEAFEEVRAQQQIVRFLGIQKIEAVIDVPETMISLVPLVEKMTARFDALPNLELDAQITEIGAEASLTTRTYPVTVIMDQPENAKILPGMSGTFTVKQVKSGVETQALVVPPTALRPAKAGSDAMAVWIVEPGKDVASLRPITLGRVVQGGVEVTSGLTAGEWVVSAGANTLAEGERVRLPGEDHAS